MNLIKWIKNEINYFGVPKERRLDYILQQDISRKTGFKASGIELLLAKRLKPFEEEKEFAYYEFVYKKKTYSLTYNELKEIEPPKKKSKR